MAEGFDILVDVDLNLDSVSQQVGGRIQENARLYTYIEHICPDGDGTEHHHAGDGRSLVASSYGGTASDTTESERCLLVDAVRTAISEVLKEELGKERVRSGRAAFKATDHQRLSSVDTPDEGGSKVIDLLRC